MSVQMIGRLNWRSLLVMHRCVAGTFCTEPNRPNLASIPGNPRCPNYQCSVHTTINLGCKRGYNYLGQRSITCIKYNTWFPPPGTCEPIDYGE